MSMGRPMPGPEIEELARGRQRAIEAELADPHRAVRGGSGPGALLRAVQSAVRRLLGRDRG
jgi:hypothetical protein